ncbi:MULTISPECIES: class I adenylate-forming enzyme family protein [Pseudonocardia]|uniref:ATP-dependent acyl-CoA ligase n=2 Tax=Pseudonocardia TaxID=1847 RepID=A0ABQ0S6Z6_9PSEU|nr:MULTISPECIES: AMP-binding protein [Pseudonocardia]OSY42002.1 putative sulfoacetate--CoA ligase [Pseudonocardia autotrophica]TDN75229.1 crotonobetaine/carnitine-CoA ligase [Pseudonocardia autotrophica]BBF99174.1 ATP-dependent acyl-CoA ligase [Pseudonocardia autotrophica]GEC28573.1 ATP-dependent acyl-CoA ligase [Pseudonocardia saturnea]
MAHDAYDLLSATATTRPDAPFLLFDGDDALVRIGYAEQVRRADATAGLLAGLGIGAGDRVHLMTANRPEFLDVWFACARLGAVVVPVNPLSTTAEVTHQLDDSGAALSVVDPQLWETVTAAAGDRTVLDADELVAARADAPPPPPHRRAAIAAIMFTSGTTSAPKGVQVTPANYLRSGRAVAEHLGVTGADRWLVTLPLFHGNAQYYCLMSALVAGGSIALTPRFSATGWPRQARMLEPTLASLFAAPIRMLLARSEPDPADSDNALRLVLFAQNLTDTQAATFEERFGAPLVQLYGMTETVVPPLVNPLDERRRWDSVGLPLAGVRIRVVGPDGSPVPRGTPGELQIGGTPGVDVTPGYHGRPEATVALFDDGWLRTGDLVRQDGAGRVHFVDRAGDLVKRAGENVSTGEVEQAIGAHPAVLESAVHGMPDPLYDETVVAHVVLRDGHAATPEELIAWCRERLSRFKVPERVLVRSELPRTTIGKIRKDVLRAELAPEG